MYPYYVRDSYGNVWSGEALNADDAQERAIGFWESIEQPHYAIVSIRRQPNN